MALAGSDRPERWREALALVRGRPFEGLRSSDWPILEGIAPAIESAVVDLSGRLAGAYLRQGDPQGAEWAARRGLVVSPYDERLYRMLMRAADLGGNPAGVDAVMSELLTLVADGIEPLEAVHPSTMDLYRQSEPRAEERDHPPRRPAAVAAIHGPRGYSTSSAIVCRVSGSPGHQQGGGDGLPPPLEVVPDLLLRDR